MKLPYGDQAVVPQQKIVDYLLSAVCLKMIYPEANPICNRARNSF